MRHFYILFVLTFFLTCCLSSEEVTPELLNLNHLIETLKKNVQIQENVRVQLINYQKLSKEFIKNPDDMELLFQLIKSADILFANIKESHITHNFSPEFLNELTLFSKIGSKKGVPRP